MSVTPDQIKIIRVEISRLKPARVRLDGSRPLTAREAIFALAPTLERSAGAASTCRTDGEAARQHKALLPVTIFYAPKENYQYPSG